MAHHVTIPSPAFEIRALHWLYQHRSDDLRRQHSSDQFMIVYIDKGKMIHCIDEQKHEMTEQLYIVTPGCVHQMYIEPDTQGFVIYIHPAAVGGFSLLDILHSNLFAGNMVHHVFDTLPQEDKQEFAELFERLYYEFERHDLSRIDIWMYYLLILMSHITRLQKQSGPLLSPIPQMQVVRKFIGMVEKDFRSRKGVADYAVELGLTTSHLAFLVRKVTGLTPSHHIRNRIIREAKRQAIMNGLTMKENAYYLGFEDISHFSKFFKTSTGIRYSDYRNTHTTACGKKGEHLLLMAHAEMVLMDHPSRKQWS